MPRIPRLELRFYRRRIFKTIEAEIFIFRIKFYAEVKISSWNFAPLAYAFKFAPLRF